MLVGMWMTRNVVTVSPGTFISDAAVEMSHRGIRRLPVVESSPEELVGIVSAGDVARAFPPDLNPSAVVAGERQLCQPVSAIMTRRVRTATPSTPIEQAARVLRDHKIGAMPVLRDSRLVGIITESDILQAFIETTGIGERGVRITFDLSDDEDVVIGIIEIARRHGVRIASIMSMLHDGKRLGVARLQGPDSERVIEDIWKSGHRIISVEGGSRQSVPRALIE